MECWNQKIDSNNASYKGIFMKRKHVESSMIFSIGYGPEISTLEIEFKSGAIWQYYDVPESLWFEFENADSKGKFFNREIRDQYSELKVG